MCIDRLKKAVTVITPLREERRSGREGPAQKGRTGHYTADRGTKIRERGKREKENLCIWLNNPCVAFVMVRLMKFDDSAKYT